MAEKTGGAPQLDIYTVGDGIADRSRLDRITEIFRPTTQALLDRVDVRPGMACLDVGCGTGGVAFDLARRVGPAGRVVGLDMDDIRIEEGRRDAAARVPNVEFRLADIRTLSDPVPEFDVVYSRFLLDHVAHPAKVLSTMYGMLKPDGKLVAECTDFSGWYCFPALPAFDRAVKLLSEERKRTGGFPDIGARLPVLLLDAGLADVRTRIFQHMELAGVFKSFMLTVLTPDRAEWIVTLGIADEAEVEQVLAEVTAHIESPRAVMGTPRFVQCWGSKPKPQTF
jgi:SAM-dependent methyltransferase